MPNEEEVFNKLAEEVKKWLKEKAHSLSSVDILDIRAAPTTTSDIQVKNSPKTTILPSPPAQVSNSTRIKKVNEFDVSCGACNSGFKFVGNIRYRELICRFGNDFAVSTYPQASAIVDDIFQVIRNDGGRFLKKDEATGDLCEISEKQAKKKITCALKQAKYSPLAIRNNRRTEQIRHEQVSTESIAPVGDSTEIVYVNELDIVYGLTTSDCVFMGNIRYSQLIYQFAVASFFSPYPQAVAAVASQVFYLVRCRGGRFLEKKNGKAFFEMSDDKAQQNILESLLYQSLLCAKEYCQGQKKSECIPN